MILIPVSAGMGSSIAMTLLKAATIVNTEVGLTGGASLYVYAICALSTAQIELYTLNRAMNLFD